MFKTAYDTLACRSYDTSVIKNALVRAAVEDELMSVKIPNTNMSHKAVKNVMAVKPGDEDVPVFNHPFPISPDDLPDSAADPVFCLDGRTYMKVNRDGQYIYTNAADFKYQIMRAVLNEHWLKEPRDLFNLGDLCPLVFCRWLTQNIVKRFGLGPGEQVKIMTVSLFYWYSLFRTEDDGEFEEKEKMAIMRKLAQISAIPTSAAMSLVDEMYTIQGIDQYVGLIKHVTGSSRLDKLEPAFIFASLGGSWFGPSANELIAVATEHPPTFIAMVISALEERSFRKARLAQLVYDYDKRGRGDIVIKNARHLIGQNLVE